MTNEAYKDELNAAAERKQGQSRLVYDKTKRTIIAEGLHAPGDGFTVEDAEKASRETAERTGAFCPDCNWRMDKGHSPTCKLRSITQKAASPLHAMLNERGSRYGKFVDHAETTQSIKQEIYKRLKAKTIKADQIEALEMIAHKIGRIVCGDPDYIDSWTDIAGYATLVAQRLESDQNAEAKMEKPLRNA